MRHEDNRARIVNEERLEPRDRFDVEMIGRLVEQQQVRLRHERTREQHPAPPASRECVNDRVRRELQVREHRLDTLLEPPAILLLELVLQTAQGFERRGRRRLRDLHSRMVIIAYEIVQTAEPLGDDVEDRDVGRQGNVLHQPGNAKPGLPPD